MMALLKLALNVQSYVKYHHYGVIKLLTKASNRVSFLNKDCINVDSTVSHDTSKNLLNLDKFNIGE